MHISSSEIFGHFYFWYHNELTNDLEKRERGEKKPRNIRKQRFKISTWITLVSETVFFFPVISESSKFNLEIEDN